VSLPKSDFIACLCGHDAGFHCKQFTVLPGDRLNTLIGYMHCEWNDNHYTDGIYGQLYLYAGCKCNKFKQDNLRYLERKSEHVGL
jgi:hypothetical protein